MAKFDIKTVKPKFVVTTSPDNKIDVVVNKPIITSKNTKSFFQLKNTGGPKGEKGDKGDAATITVASTATGAAGTDASVVNQGTAQDVQLAFTIPRGDKGDTGATGPAGYSPKAKVEKTGHDAVITIQDQSGTTTATVSDGQDGQDGQAATIAISSTETLPAGSSATVENVGTSLAASLAFGIPQGVAGQDGADGFSPTATITQTSSGATISITDKDGTTTADVSNGADGTDGFSPVATVTPTATGATISITDAQGTTTADVANGTDGDAATIQIGQVETLLPSQQAYVQNVGSSTAAIFNIGIPQGEKGESGSGSGDMLAADYDPNSTVKNAGGITSYVSSQLPGDMTGATSSTAGAHGLVPAPAAGDQAKYLKGDGTWANTPAPELVEMAYGESNAWAKFIAAYNAHCVVYCRASSNANPATGSQTRKAFMAYVNNADSPTSVEFQYYRSVSSKSDSQQGDQVFVYTLTNSNGGTWSVTTRNTFSKIAAGTNMASSYSSGTLTLNATDTTYSDMTGATSSAAGAHGLVPAPSAGDQDKVLKGDGTWGEVAGSEVILYVNKSQYDLNITGGSSAFTIYTDSGYTTAATLSTITDATSAGQTVTIKTNDSCEMKVLGDLGTGGYQETYFSAVLANNRGVGKLTYSGSSSDWTFNPGSVVETPGSGVLTITQNGTSAGTFSANASSNSTIALTDTTYSTMTGATSVADGTSGLVPAPTAGNQTKVLSGAGTWVNQPTVNDGRITFTQNGNFLGEFSANTAHTSTIEIENIYADPIASSAAITPLVQTSMIADGAVTADKTNFSTYGLNTTVQIGTDVDDDTPVYRTTLGSNSLAMATSTWVLLGNLFGSGTGTVKTIYSLNFVLRDSGGTNFCAYGYDGGAAGGALGTSRPLLAKVLSNGNVLIACANDNFSAAKVRVTVEYTKN